MIRSCPLPVLTSVRCSLGTVYAIFIPDQHRGQAAIDYYETNRDNFNRQMEKFHDRISPCRSASDMHAAWEAGKTAAFLTIEGGAALAVISPA